MDQKHNFFAAEKYADKARPLSDYLGEQLTQQNEVLMSGDTPEVFVIPDHLLAVSSLTKRIITVKADHILQFENEQTTYRRFQVRVLNTIFSAQEALTPSDIVTSIGSHANIKQQKNAIESLYRKTSDAKLGTFLSRIETGNQPLYSVNPDVAFLDKRGATLTPEQEKRQEAIKDLCQRFGDDPYVLRELAEYAVCPIEDIPSSWLASDVVSYQARHFKYLPEEECQTALDELDDLLAAHMAHEATEEDQKRAVILTNKLIYSYMKLSRALVRNALGTAHWDIGSPVNGFMKNFSRNSLEKPIDDAFALADLGVVWAVQTYTKGRGKFLNHVITQVAYKMRDGVLDITRHSSGRSLHEVKNDPHTPYRRMHPGGGMDFDKILEVLPAEGIADPNYEYEEFIRDINTAPFIHFIFSNNEFGLADKLILSLSYGIYCDELEGRVLKGVNRQKFMYDSSLRTNPLFRDGMTDKTLGTMFGIPGWQVGCLRRAMYTKMTNLIRSSLPAQYSNKKWTTWIW